MKCILTFREKQILKYVATGENTSDIAKILNISENTVLYHLKNINKKLEANNRTHAVIKAISLDLIDID